MLLLVVGLAGCSAAQLHARRILHEACASADFDINVTAIFAEGSHSDALYETCVSAASACLADKSDDECSSYAGRAVPEVRGAASQIDLAIATLPAEAPTWVTDMLTDMKTAFDGNAFANVRTCKQLEAAIVGACNVPSVVLAVFAATVVCLIVGCAVCCCLYGCCCCVYGCFTCITTAICCLCPCKRASRVPTVPTAKGTAALV